MLPQINGLWVRITHGVLEISKYRGNQLNSVNIVFRIALYATTSTEESVYIIGGSDGEIDYNGGPDVSSVIAEYKNDEWFNIGNLQQARYSHGAITSGSWTMIIGGSSADGP